MIECLHKYVALNEGKGCRLRKQLKLLIGFKLMPDRHPQITSSTTMPCYPSLIKVTIKTVSGELFYYDFIIFESN